MKKASKRFRNCLQGVEQNKLYSLEEAITVLKNLPHPKFDETVEVACNVNIDPKQPEQMIRGNIVLPQGIGKEVRVCVLCKGEDVNKAKEAGADFAGGKELIEKIEKGWMEFDKVASTPEMMKDVAQLGKLLGPRGLMPSPKAGTVGPDIVRIIKDLKGGKIQFKTDKTGNVHSIIGKVSFSVPALSENALTLFKAIAHMRPAAVKGRLLNSITITTTMGPGLRLDIGKLAL